MELKLGPLQLVEGLSQASLRVVLHAAQLEENQQGEDDQDREERNGEREQNDHEL
jgi:hypothetical protein